MQLSFICTYMPCSWRSVITFDSTAHAWPTVLRWYLAKQTEGGNCTHNVYRPSFHVIHSLLIFYESKRPKYVYPPLMLVERRSPADPGSCVWVEAKPFAMQDICLSQAGPQMTKAPRCYSADSGVQLPFNSRALGSGYHQAEKARALRVQFVEETSQIHLQGRGKDRGVRKCFDVIEDRKSVV